MDLRIQDIMLCKIYMTVTSLKALEQMVAMEEDMMKNNISTCSDSPSPQTMSSLISMDTTTSFSSKDEEMAASRVKESLMIEGGSHRRIRTCKVLGIGKVYILKMCMYDNL